MLNIMYTDEIRSVLCLSTSRGRRGVVLRFTKYYRETAVAFTDGESLLAEGGLGEGGGGHDCDND